jgi:hypothetical protein
MNTLPQRIRCAYFGVGSLLAAILISTSLCMAVWPHLNWAQNYPEPIAGNITWLAENKDRDYLTVALFLLTAAAGAAGIGVACWRAAPDGPDSDLGSALRQIMLLSLVPAAWRLTIAALLPQPTPPPPIRTVTLLPLGAALVIAALGRYRGRTTPWQVFSIAGAALLTPLLGAFAGLGVALLPARLIPGAVQHLQHGHTALFAQVGLVLAVLAVITIYILSNTIELLENSLLRCLQIAQVPLPLLLFYLVPPRLIDPLHRFANPYPRALVVTLSVCCIASWWCMWRRFHRPINQAADAFALPRAIAPAAVAALMVFILVDPVGLPTAVDWYFHWGEQVLPWQQWHDFGKRPYIDFVPIHGLMAFGRGALNQAFFDGTAANYFVCDSILTGIAAAATALAACALLSPLAALVLLTALLPLDRIYLLTPGLYLLAAPRLVRRPAGWVLAWLLLCVIECAYNPALGPAFVAASAPFGLWGLWRLLRRSWIGFAILLAGVAIVVGVFVGVPILHQTVAQYVHFVADNGWTNAQANAIAWEEGIGQRDRTSGVGSSQFLWEICRFGWIAVAIAGAAVWWRQWCRPAPDRNLPAMIFGGSVALALVISAPWVMARLDAGYFTRSGYMTEAAMFLLLPPLVLLCTNARHVGRDLLLTSIAVGAFYLITPTRLDPAALAAKPAEMRYVPADAPFADGAKLNLPRLGQIVPSQPDFLPDLVEVHNTLNSFLKPGETFLDFTNGLALYFFFDMPNPVRYAAYVATNSRLQAGMMQQLRQHPVPVVLAWPQELFDGEPTSLRCYRPYHDYVMKFAMVKRGHHMYLVDPARVPEAGPIGSEPQLQLLDTAFSCWDLRRIPIAWGQSWRSMAKRFDPVAKVPALQSTTDVRTAAPGMLAATGTNPAVTFGIPPAVTDGAAADYVRFKFDFTPTNPGLYRQAIEADPIGGGVSCEPELALRWFDSTGHPSPTIWFMARPGNLLVPLGAFPRWLLGQHPSALEVRLVSARWVRQFAISDVEFLRLKDE